MNAHLEGLLGYFLPPFPSLRLQRDYRGWPLGERFGGGRVLALTIARDSITSAVLGMSPAAPGITRLSPAPCKDWTLQRDVLASLKGQANTEYLAVTFARPPESDTFQIWRNLKPYVDDLNFHIAVSSSAHLVAPGKAKEGHVYRALRHQSGAQALAAATNPDWQVGVERVASETGMKLVRTQLLLLQLANIGLADPRVRKGASLLILDNRGVLLITSTAEGFWEDPRYRSNLKADPNQFTEWVNATLVPSLKSPAQRKIVLVDTQTSAPFDVKGALAACDVEPLDVPGFDSSDIPILSLAAA